MKKILAECVPFYKNLYSSKSMTYYQNDTTFWKRQLWTGAKCVWRSVNRKRMPRGTQRYGNRKDPWDWRFASWILQVILEVSTILIRALKYADETGQLSVTQSRGIIKLIPKKDERSFWKLSRDTCLEYLSSWGDSWKARNPCDEIHQDKRSGTTDSGWKVIMHLWLYCLYTNNGYIYPDYNVITKRLNDCSICMMFSFLWSQSADSGKSTAYYHGHWVNSLFREDSVST